MNRPMNRTAVTLAIAGALWAASQGPARTADAPRDRVRAALAAICPGPPPALDSMALALGGAEGAREEPVTMRGRTLGWRRHFPLQNGDRIVVERFAPSGCLRRINIIYHQAVAGRAHSDPPRPALVAMAMADCRIVEGRRMIYGADGGAVAVEILASDLVAVRATIPVLGSDTVSADMQPIRNKTGMTSNCLIILILLFECFFNLLRQWVAECWYLSHRFCY